MHPPLSVTILYNKSNQFGLKDDVAIIERFLKQSSYTIQKPRIADIREQLIHSDIQIHLEIPVFGAISWAHINIMLVNPEQWAYAFDDYVHAFDLLLFRDPIATEQFCSDLRAKGIAVDHLRTLPWCSSVLAKKAQPQTKTEFVCFVGGSTNKYAYLKKVIQHWLEQDPPLTIYTTRTDVVDGLRKANPSKHINIICQDLTTDECQHIMSTYRGHLVVSAGEGFGYAAANAESYGAFTIMNELSIWKSMYHSSSGVSWLSNEYEQSDKMRYAFASPSTSVREELDRAFTAFYSMNDVVKKERQQSAAVRFSVAADAFTTLLPYQLVLSRRPKKGVYHCPPILHVEDCPPITIITPTYNRNKMIDIVFHNLLSTDYPRNKIEWVVIEDNEKKQNMASEKIVQFQLQVPDLKIKYIPIEGRMTIGEKRNHAINEAMHDIILFMDDDDHYPSTSFRRRVAWLTKGIKCGKTTQRIACCTTLALYDLQHGISAVNVPPYDIPFAQRISEATLTFHKSAWKERPFPSVSVAEGEGWIQGREQEVIEMPPQQIIVAFTHGANATSRRIPRSDQPPSCFWGFPKEYLIFIHGLVGVDIV